VSPAPFIAVVDPQVPISNVPAEYLRTFGWHIYVNGIPDGVALSAPNGSLSKSVIFDSPLTSELLSGRSEVAFRVLTGMCLWAAPSSTSKWHALVI
jgi:hypothetical protein